MFRYSQFNDVRVCWRGREIREERGGVGERENRRKREGDWEREKREKERGGVGEREKNRRKREGEIVRK